MHAWKQHWNHQLYKALEQQISECKEAGLKRGENGSGELSGSLTNKKTVLRAISQTY